MYCMYTFIYLSRYFNKVFNIIIYDVDVYALERSSKNDLFKNV